MKKKLSFMMVALVAVAAFAMQFTGMAENSLMSLSGSESEATQVNGAELTGLGSDPVDVLFDFTANEWGHALGSGFSDETTKPGELWEPLSKDGIDLVFKHGTSTNTFPPRYWTGPQVRIYKNQVLKVLAPAGKAITNIVFTANGTNFKLKADGLTDKTWTGNATGVKFISDGGTTQLTKMVVTLADKNGETTAIAAEADEVTYLDFNDPTIHKEFNVVENTYLSDEMTVLDGDGESRVRTTIVPVENATDATQNYLRYASSKVSLYLRTGGKLVFKTSADKIFKNIKMTASAVNATINGEAVTKAQITGDGWTGDTNVVELEATGVTNISNITFTLADKPEPVETSYYVVGSMNEWTIADAYKLEANPETEGEYMFTGTFEAGAQLKVKDSNDTWYPDGMDNNFTIADAGEYTIYFRPDGQGGEGWHYGCIYAQKKEAPQGIVPNGEFYVMNVNKGTVINAAGGVDAKGAPITFTYNAETESYTLAGADILAGKQWTIANLSEEMPGYFVISTMDGETKKYLAANDENQVVLSTLDSEETWIVLEKAYWEDIVNSTYTVAGTKNLTGTENDWDVVEANKMTYNDETKLFEMTYKKITVNNETKPEFKVVKQPMEGAAVWYPEGDNWVITPDVVGGEGLFDITITFDPSDLKEIKVSALQYADIEISPAEGDIAAALAEVSAGKKVRNITINLTKDVTYTIGSSIVAGGNVVINGNGATIDASALAGNFIEMAVVEKPTEWTEANVTVKELTVKGLKKALFYSACKNYFGDVTVDKCVVEQAADAITFDYTKGSTAVNFTVTNSTFYAPTATTKSFYSSQSGQKTTEWDANATQTFKFENNTMYNLARGKNFFTHRQNSQKWLKFVAKNNIFVDCGKSGQTIKGMNGGGSSANPQFDIDGNLFNFGGADTGAAEETGDADEPVQNTIAGVVTFTDAAAGNFNGTIKMTEYAETPASLGAPMWTLKFDKPLVPNGEFYVMNVNKGTVINAAGGVDAKGAPITFTYNAETESYTLAGADILAGKQWTIANLSEEMPGYFVISTMDGETKKYLAANDENQVVLSTLDSEETWIVLEKAYWEDIVNSTYTVAGTKNLTGTENDWDIVEANKMTYNEETKLFEITYKEIAVNNDTKPEFKVVKQPMEGEAVWYPENNWVITPDVTGSEGIFDITITFDPSDLKEITVSSVKIENVDLKLTESCDIAAAINAAMEGKNVRSVKVELAKDVNYTFNSTVTIPGALTVWGNDAVIDASALEGNMFQWAALSDLTEWTKADVEIAGVTVKGLKKALFYSNGKNYVAENFTVNYVNVEQAGDAITFDFTKGSTAKNFTVENSTFYAPTATTKSFYSSQSGQKTTEWDTNATQTFKFHHNTMYNLAPSKNFFTHRQNSQKWLAYDVQENIFVNCGKSGQVIKGFNGGGSSSNPTWIVKGNAFNFDGADTSAAEDTGDTTEGEGVQNSVAGIVTFTDAANGDFNGTFELADGAVAPASLGAPAWTITFKAAPVYIVAGNNAEIFGNPWNPTDEANKMTKGLDGKYSKTYTVADAINDVQLKVVENGMDWYGDAQGNNVTFNLTGAGEFTVTIDPATKEVSVTGDNVKFPTAPKFYVIGGPKDWKLDDMTEMTFNAETQTFEFEYAPTTTAYFAFADKQFTAEEAAADGAWDVFNANNRYALGAGDIEATLNEAVALQKVNGTIVLKPVKEGTSYKISVAADFSTVTITGEAAPDPEPVVVDQLYIMGTGTTGAWNTTTEMTFNETTQAFEYEVTNNGTLYITFGDAEFTNWDDWNANNRIAIDAGDQDAPVGTEFDLIKANGTLVLEAGTYKISVTKALKCTITATSTGINGVKNAAALKDAQIFNISGQRVEKAHKGLYIVNGRKVVVK